MVESGVLIPMHTTTYLEVLPASQCSGFGSPLSWFDLAVQHEIASRPSSPHQASQMRPSCAVPSAMHADPRAQGQVSETRDVIVKPGQQGLGKRQELDALCCGTQLSVLSPEGKSQKTNRLIRSHHSGEKSWITTVEARSLWLRGFGATLWHGFRSSISLDTWLHGRQLRTRVHGLFGSSTVARRALASSEYDLVSPAQDAPP
ncbi:hypothetical protein B0J13DRAFT_663097 [Dactylonectria estremocensis]|uniref:Uncharacterized protein n=1 Tax=Dactylonectria estremocensis TaxID=1079267 RepID=A0A9P9JAR0_9HYPO|nr:hypothetical protein B0J13DRAFT_663097 [Dactylonectria estremocensis]